MTTGRSTDPGPTPVLHDAEAEKTRRKRPKDRRERIVRAAAHLFRERGYPAVSIYDIGEAVGVSGAALYRHFANKEAVLIAAYQKSIERLKALDQPLAEDAAPPERLATQLRTELGAVLADMDMAAMYLREARHIEIKPPDLLAAHRSYIERWVALVRDVRPELDRDEARFVVMGLSGVSSSILYYRLQMPAGQLLDTLCRAGVAAVLSRPVALDGAVVADGDGAGVEEENGAEGLRRETILAVALRMFRQHGFHGVSIDAIGDAAGITGPSVYRHFQNKEALLEAAFDLGYQQIMASARSSLEAARSPQQALALLIDSYVERAIENADLVAVYMTESRALGPERERAVRRNQRAYVNEWIDVLREVRPELSEAEARVLVQAAIGILNVGGQDTRHVSTAFARAQLRAMANGALTA